MGVTRMNATPQPGLGCVREPSEESPSRSGTAGERSGDESGTAQVRQRLHGCTDVSSPDDRTLMLASAVGLIRVARCPLTPLALLCHKKLRFFYSLHLDSVHAAAPASSADVWDNARLV